MFSSTTQHMMQRVVVRQTIATGHLFISSITRKTGLGPHQLYSSPCPRVMLATRKFGSTSHVWLQLTAKACEKRYSQDHEWVEINKGNENASIGISRHAADSLGDIVYVELPSEGNEVKKGDLLGTVESVKSVSDIVSPVSGTVVSTNTTLIDSPSIINQDPEGDAWIVKVSLQDKEQLKSLMTNKEYSSFVE